MAGLLTFPTFPGEGTVKPDGDATFVQKLQDVIVQFTPDIPILPGLLIAL